MTTLTPIQQAPLVHHKRKETVEHCEALITEKMLREAFGIPSHAKIFIGIPGGGNWSNTDLPISDSVCEGIQVYWKEEY